MLGELGSLDIHFLPEHGGSGTAFTTFRTIKGIYDQTVALHAFLLYRQWHRNSLSAVAAVQLCGAGHREASFTMGDANSPVNI